METAAFWWGSGSSAVAEGWGCDTGGLGLSWKGLVHLDQGKVWLLEWIFLSFDYFFLSLSLEFSVFNDI